MRHWPSLTAKPSHRHWARLMLVLALVQQAVAGGVLQTAHAMAMAGLGSPALGVVLCSDAGRAGVTPADPDPPGGAGRGEHCPCCTLACCCTGSAMPALPAAGWRVHLAEAGMPPGRSAEAGQRPSRPRPTSDIATRGPPGATL